MLPATSPTNLPERIQLKPIHAEFGARVSGVDLSRPLDDQIFAEIDFAINQYSFLLFENQDMNDAAHLVVFRAKP